MLHPSLPDLYISLPVFYAAILSIRGRTVNQATNEFISQHECFQFSVLKASNPNPFLVWVKLDGYFNTINRDILAEPAKTKIIFCSGYPRLTMHWRQRIWNPQTHVVPEPSPPPCSTLPQPGHHHHVTTFTSKVGTSIWHVGAEFSTISHYPAIKQYQTWPCKNPPFIEFLIKNVYCCIEFPIKHVHF